jgi:hypothetical protein
MENNATGTTATKPNTISHNAGLEGILLLLPKSGVVVQRVKYDLICLKCGKTWGVYLNSDIPPYLWDMCRACDTKKRNEQKWEIQRLYRAETDRRRDY